MSIFDQLFGSAPQQDPHDKALRRIDQIFDGEPVEAEYIPSATKGQGRYVFIMPENYDVGMLTRLGMGGEEVRRMENYVVAQWLVPPAAMEAAVPGGMMMVGDELNQALRSAMRERGVTGYENAIITNMNAGPHNEVAMDVRATTSAKGFTGTDLDNGIVCLGADTRHVVIPEQRLLQAMGLAAANHLQK